MPLSFQLFKLLSIIVLFIHNKKWLLQSWHVPNVHTLGQIKSKNSCFLMEGPNNEDHNPASIDAFRLNELDFEWN